MSRVTVLDSERVVSFAVTDDVLPRMVAACCSRPANLEDFLLAAEAFQHGITRQVVNALIDFDNAVSRGGLDEVYRRLDEDIDSTSDTTLAFEATEPRLEELSRRFTGPPLLFIDLAACRLEMSPGLDLQRRGQVQLHDGTDVRAQTVTYELPDSYHLSTAETPDSP
jgi:hypothetical protein